MRLMSKIYNLNDPGWGRGKGNSEPPRQPDNKQGNGGPPDLDEVWRDFNNRVGSLFGRKGRSGGGGAQGGGGGSPMQLPKGSPKMLVGGVVVLAVLWLASGFVVVQEGQVAVVTKFGKYVKTLNPGLQWHMPYPIEAHETVNISQLRTFEVGFRGSARNKVLPESLMLTTDENIVDVQYVVQYRLMANGAPDYLFKTSDPDESVRQAAETAMREVVGLQPMDSVLYSARTQIAADVQTSAQEILDRYQTGIQVSTVAIQNVQPPEQVQAAFDDAVKAGQDRERQINEGNAYASQVIPEAEGNAARLIQEAEGYRAAIVSRAEGDSARFSSIEAEYAKAPDVTRERMYLTTMQAIFEKSGKVFLDSESSNNMLYLPLDKIMQQASRGPDAAKQSAAAAANRPPAENSSSPPAAARTAGSNNSPYSSGSSSSLSTSPYSR